MAPTEYAHLAILYCDLSRSTHLSTVLEPEALRDLLLTYRRKVTECVVQGGGVIAEVSGDGLLAYFGYPHSTEFDAEAAIRVARRACETTTEINVDGHIMAMHASVATGNVIVGPTEDELLSGATVDEKWSDFIAFGEALNLAARLLSLAQPGEVVICDTTRTLTGELFSYTELPARKFKGFDSAISSWRVEGENAVASRFLALRERALAPITGRSNELEMLDELWHKTIVAQNKGQVILIHGEAGIGKSRLTEELIDAIIPFDSVWLRYFTAPHLQQTAYGPLINQMTWAAQLSEHDSDDVSVEKIRKTIPKNVNDIDAVVSMFAYLLSLRNAKAYPTYKMSAERVRQHIFETFATLMRAFAVEKPMLIVVEDVHWLDVSSRQFINRMIEQIESLPVLLVMTSRPEGVPEFDSRVVPVPIDVLAQSDASTMITSIGDRLGVSFNQDVVERITERADGIPLFIEDITQYYVEQLVSVGDGDPLAEIPTKLKGLLKVRLDNLAEAKRIAQVGAIYGREFPSTEVQRVLGMEPGAFRRGMARLLNSGLVTTIPAGGWFRHQFKHALVRDVAYNTLTRVERVRYHGAVAESFERQGDTAVLPAEVVAEQYFLANNAGKAIEYFVLAGERAVDRSIFSAAVWNYQRALEIVRDQPAGHKRKQQELALMISKGAAQAGNGGFADPGSGETFGEALAIGQSMPVSPELFAAYSGAGSYHITVGHFDKVQSLARQCLTHAKKQHDITPQVIGYRLLGGAQFLAGELNSARDTLETTIKLYDQMRGNYEQKSHVFTQDHKSTAHCYLALVLAVCGQFEQARMIGEEGLAHSREVGNLHTLNFSLCYYAAMLHFLRDDSETIKNATESYDLAQKYGFGTWSGISQVLRGECLIHQGQVEQGFEDVMQGVEGHEASNALTYQAFGMSLLVKSLQAIGKFDEAKQHLTTAINLTKSIGELWYLPELMRLMAKDAAHRRNFDEAHTTVDEALLLASQQGAALWELKLTTQKAQLYKEADDRALSCSCLEPVVERFSHRQNNAHIDRARMLLDTVC